MTENERVGLVFVKTGSINSGTGKIIFYLYLNIREHPCSVTEGIFTSSLFCGMMEIKQATRNITRFVYVYTGVQVANITRVGNFRPAMGARTK